MKKRNIVIVVVFAAAIAAVILVPRGVGGGTSPGGAELSRGAPPAAGPGMPAGPSIPTETRQAFTVRSTKVIREDLQTYLELNGEVDFVAKLDVYPDTAGRMEWLSAQPGDRVTKGQLLARVDPSRPGERYELSPVYAPTAGTVVAVNLAEGATLSTATAIMRIAKSDELEISARVNEREIAVLKAGLKASLSLEAWPGISFPATVKRVSPVVDPTSRTKEIILKLDQADSRVNAGMFAKIRLDTSLHRNLTTVPTNAVVSYYDERYVWVLEADSTVQRRVVIPGVSVDGRTAIRTGLTEGERIILEGTQVLSEGAAVRDVASTSASSSAAPATAAVTGTAGGAQ
ncbi:MAG: efflux RND transporter periplasmic adaptor subunit [Spirochaetota bacterium]